MITKRCPRCSAVVYRLLTDEYDDIRAIECIVCYERWYVDVRNVPGPRRNRYVLVAEDVKEPKRSSNIIKVKENICAICNKPFKARRTDQLYCNSAECQKASAKARTDKWKRNHGQNA